MATSGITTFGDRTIVYGGATGIDTASLIKVAHDAKKRPSDLLQTKISANTTKIAAYSELQTLAQSFQTSLAGLKKNYSSISNNSAFDSRTGTLSSNTAVSGASLVDVAIDPATELGSHQIIVQQKAQVHRVTSFGQSSVSVGLGMTGSFSLGLVGKTPVNVNVTPTTTLQQLADAINSGSATSGVKATLAQVTATNYELVLTGSDTNKSLNLSNVVGTNVLKNLGVVNAGGAYNFVLQAPQPSILRLDGVNYTRDGYEFDDLIAGVDIDVRNADPSTTLQLDIQNDTTAIEDGVNSFIESYNALRDFIKKNQTVEEGVVSEDAILFGDFTMKSLSYDVQALLANNYGETTAQYRNLRDLGLTLDGDGRLQLNTTKLQDALKNKFSEVRQLFETSTTSNNTNFRMISNTSQSTSLTAAINITYSGGAITGVSVGGDNTLFDINGTLITGKAGTAYEGMSFAYVGTSSTTVNFSMRQGIADLLNTAIERYASVTSGEIQDRKMELDTSNTAMQARSDEILERADDYREKLIERYANFEQQIARAKTTLAQIQAILNANNKD